jgi:hypothetical protein
VVLLTCPACTSQPGSIEVEPSHLTVKYRPDANEQQFNVCLTNRGADNITVQTIRSSCGCTVAGLLVPQTLHAGGSTQLSLVISPPVFGTSEATVSIVTDSPTTPLYTINISLEGDTADVPRVTMQTPRMELAGLRPGELLDGELEVHTLERESPVWIHGLSCPGNFEWSLREPVESVSLGGGVVERVYFFRIRVECPETNSLTSQLFPLTDSNQRASDRTTVFVASRRRPLSVVPGKITLKEMPVSEPIAVVVISQDDEMFRVNGTAAVIAETDQRIAASQRVMIDPKGISEVEWAQKGTLRSIPHIHSVRQFGLPW